MKMDLRKNEKIMIEGSIVKIDSFYAFNRLVNGAEFDLSSPEYNAYRGGILRIWIDNDYNLTTKRNPSQVWLLAEIPLPYRQFETKETDEKDEDGNPVTEQIEIPMVIVEGNCNVFPLPPAK
jgi:hypothetical protein